MHYLHLCLHVFASCLYGAGLCAHATTAILYSDGEEPIAEAFHKSKAFAQAARYTRVRSSTWARDAMLLRGHALVLGVETVERFHKLCTAASCKREFEDACSDLAQSLRSAGQQDKADCVLKMCRDGEGYHDLPPVMMNGPLGPRVIENVANKLKRTEASKRNVFMLVNALLCAACDLAPHQVVGIHKINKFFKALIRKQRMRDAPMDASSFEILSRACQKLSFHAINMIKQRLAQIPDVVVDDNVCHDGNDRYRFRPKRDPQGKWTCTDVTSGPSFAMCWQNMLHGIPCVHILATWTSRLRSRHHNFDFKDVETSVHKLYRRSTYELQWTFFSMVI